MINQKTNTKKDQLCTYCKKTNHTIDNCFLKQKHEKLNEEKAEIAFLHYMVNIPEASLLSLN